MGDVLPEIKRRADNLRCAGIAASGTSEEFEFFAQKIEVTCRKTAEWLEDAISPALIALADAGNTFRHYAQLHRNKGTPEGRRKAANNEEIAAKCFAALTLASVDTRPKDGDALASPLASGAVGSEADETPEPSQEPQP